MPDPIFNPATAVPVTPWRHAPTARTIAFHQPAATEGFTDLFNVTKAWVAVETDEEVADYDVPPVASVSGLPDRAAIFAPAFHGLTGGGASLDTLNASADDLGAFIHGKDGEERSVYEVRAGTAAQSLPMIVRPANFHAVNNPVIFAKLLPARFDAEGKLLAAALPGNIDARISVLGGTAAELAAAELGENEIAVNIDTGRIVRGDGLGGFVDPLADLSGSGPEIATAIGERLIESLKVTWPSNAGTFHFATTMAASGIFNVRTSTGYARLINSDGSLGAQVGAGVPGSEFTLTIPASGLLRALGVVSVASGGSVRSGNIDSITIVQKRLVALDVSGLTDLRYMNISSNQLTRLNLTGNALIESIIAGLNLIATPPVTTGLSEVMFFDLSNNRLTAPPVVSGMPNLGLLKLDFNRLTAPPVVTGLGFLGELYLNDNELTDAPDLTGLFITGIYLQNNRLTGFSMAGIAATSFETVEVGNNELSSEAHDAAFLSVPDGSSGSWSSSGNPGAPTAASAAKRADMIADGWFIAT